jgi:hypothetical protein
MRSTIKYMLILFLVLFLLDKRITDLAYCLQNCHYVCVGAWARVCPWCLCAIFRQASHKQASALLQFRPVSKNTKLWHLVSPPPPLHFFFLFSLFFFVKPVSTERWDMYFRVRLDVNFVQRLEDSKRSIHQNVGMKLLHTTCYTSLSEPDNDVKQTTSRQNLRHSILPGEKNENVNGEHVFFWRRKGRLS